MNPQKSGGGRAFWLKVAGIAIGLGLLYWFGVTYIKQFITMDDVLAYVEQSGPLAPLVFIIAYGFLPVLPATALTLAAGAVFGPYWGTVYSLFGATIAMSYPFWLTRWFGRKPLEIVLSKTGSFEGKFEKFQCNVEKQGWKYVAFTRLVPLFPFTLLNYFFGLTRISFWKYLVTSFFFIIPGTATYVYVGYAGREAATGSQYLYVKILLAFLALALLASIPKIYAYLKGKKKEDTGDC